MSVRHLLNIISGDQIIVEIIDVIHIGRDNVKAIDHNSKSKVKL